MTHLTMYLMVITNNINLFCGLLTIIFLILSLVTGISSIADPEERIRKDCSKIFKYTNILWSICLIIFILTPTTKQSCAIYILPKIINGEK